MSSFCLMSSSLLSSVVRKARPARKHLFAFCCVLRDCLWFLWSCLDSLALFPQWELNATNLSSSTHVTSSLCVGNNFLRKIQLFMDWCTSCLLEILSSLFRKLFIYKSVMCKALFLRSDLLILFFFLTSVETYLCKLCFILTYCMQQTLTEKV